jgi:hypothetical protein
MLAAFAVAQRLQLQRTRLERDRANRERDRAPRITNFITGMFKVSDSREQRGSNVSAREILDKASKNIVTGMAKGPVAHAQMMQVTEVLNALLKTEYPSDMPTLSSNTFRLKCRKSIFAV